MKRLAATALLLIACGTAPLWQAGANGPLSPGPNDLLTAAAALCRMIPMPMTPTAIAAALGAFLLLGCVVASIVAYRTRRMVRALTAGGARTPHRLRVIARRAGLRGGVSIVDSEGAPAFTHGLLHPQVVLSRALYASLDDAELEAVLRHEGEHARRRDPLRMLVARTVGTMLAWLPFVRPALEAYLCRLELAADRATVTAMADVVPLASALQRVMARPRRNFAAAAVSGLSATDVRIDHLLGLETSPALIAQPPHPLHVAVFWLVALAALCALVASVGAAMQGDLCLLC